MDSEKRAAGILRQAEASLRELVSAAANAGDYANVVRIAAWAKALGDILKETPAKAACSAADIDVTAASAGKPQILTKAGKQVKPQRGARAQYPRFFRQGDQLVRIAWSKRAKKEYRHKAPYAVLQALITIMSDLGKDGQVFSTDEFLPIRDDDGNDIPSYQSYVGIALLKHTSLLDQHGRQGYSIPRLGDFADTVKALWRKLPNK